jgi:hypothetical protein
MIAGLVLTTAAWAQPEVEQEAGDPRDRISPTGPWAEGITPASKQAANALLREGNTLMRDAFFSQAAIKYREAIAIWDHPAFHLNLAMAQRALDQPIEAYHSLDRAMRHGPAALGQSRYEHAGRVRALLEEQLGHLEVICHDAGAEVTLDGEPLFIGPGTQEVLVRPGPHQLVARKAGRIPATEQIAPAPGERVRVELHVRYPDKVIATRRWAAWKPWAVVGASAGFFAGAAYFDRRAGRKFDRFGSAFSQQCPEGCDQGQVPVSWTEDLQRAQTDRDVAVAGYVTGGLVLAAGAILIYLNRERVIRVAADEDADTWTMITIMPVLVPRGAGIGAGIHF